MSDWTASEVVDLRADWEAKREDGRDLYTTAEIGERCGHGKNGAISKARSVGLTPRKSPIVRHGEKSHYPAVRKAKRPSPPKSPPTESVAELESLHPEDWEYKYRIEQSAEIHGRAGANEPKAAKAGNEALVRSPPPQPVNGPEAARPRKDRPAAPAAPHYSLHECQWTDSAHRPWVFCCEPALIGRPWCAEHARRARKAA